MGTAGVIFVFGAIISPTDGDSDLILFEREGRGFLTHYLLIAGGLRSSPT